MPSGCLDAWVSKVNQARRVPLEMRGCPSSGLEAPLASLVPGASLDSRVPLVLTADRATPDLKGRRAWWVLEDNRDLRDKREKRVNVKSTHTGGNKARLASKALQDHRAPQDQAALWDTQDCQGL